MDKYSDLNFQEIDNVEIVEPRAVAERNELEIIKEALNKPFNFCSLSDFLGNVRKLLIIINDFTRPTPTEKVLDVVMSYLEGVEFDFVVASGTHRIPTEDELRKSLGKYYDECRRRVKFHNCKDGESLVYKGVSRFGTPIYVNKIVYEYDGILVIGSSEPHYFAGYTGGRKAFIPGVAGYETIALNHKFALDENSKTFALEGNPVHDDMVDIVEKLDVCNRVFSIQTVVDSEGRVCYATAGHIFDSFTEIAKCVNKVYAVDVSEKADIIIAVVESPMDVNLYQSHKALENVKLVLKDRGIIILVSRCYGGIGPDEFYRFLRDCEAPEEAVDRMKGDFKFGYHKAVKLASILSRAKVWVVSELPDRVLVDVFMKPYSSLREAFSDAVCEKGKDARVLVVKNAGVTVPVLTKG